MLPKQLLLPALIVVALVAAVTVVAQERATQQPGRAQPSPRPQAQPISSNSTSPKGCFATIPQAHAHLQPMPACTVKISKPTSN